MFKVVLGMEYKIEERGTAAGGGGAKGFFPLYLKESQRSL